MRKVMGWMFVGAMLLGVSAAYADVDPAATQKTWKAKCSSCHGMDGKGATKQGTKMKIADISSEAWQKGITDDKMKESINKGFKREKDGVKQEMAAAKLSPEQVDALVAFIRTLKP